MRLWSAIERPRPTEARVRRALASVGAVGRRHTGSVFFYTLAIVGVPVAVVMATGGQAAVGFWVVSVVWATGVTYGAILAVFIVLLVISPLLLIVSRLFPGETDAVVARMSRLGVVSLAAAGFLWAAPLGNGSDVRLPVPWPNVGALMVMALAALASYLLWLAGRKRRPAKARALPTRRHHLPEPDEEFWSDQYVTGWRSWNWDGSSLRGVYARWLSAEHEATCAHCDVVPSWDHVCGVYAAKRPCDVHVFAGWTPIIGRVEMWGDVVEHELGYRASHARIIDLWVHDPHRAARIRSAYPTVNVMVGSPSVDREVA